MDDEHLEEPVWWPDSTAVGWDDWYRLGPLLAKRHAAGLPPMRHYRWRPLASTPGWVAIVWAHREGGPEGPTPFLRLRDGAIVLVGPGADADPAALEHQVNRAAD